MQTSFTIRGKKFEIRKWDYIQYNGACYLFCTGDGRHISGSGHFPLAYVELTKKALSEFNLKELNEVKMTGYGGIKITRWYF